MLWEILPAAASLFGKDIEKEIDARMPIILLKLSLRVKRHRIFMFYIQSLK
ncbi:MAG: hypothetical protein JRJ02_14020 [Deltaproteobacteria bacterium]|nr:hypothetical protein [Deltaproteobacteria bacterium]MBW1863468.1 hypothetical protein [Deltaproteobacteria bacterium]